MSQHHKSGLWTSTDIKVWRARLSAQLPLPCTKCGRPVEAGQAWDVDHIVPLSVAPDLAREPSNLGACHRSENRASGGRAGARITNARRNPTQQDRRLPEW